MILALIWGFGRLYPNSSTLRLFLETGHKDIVFMKTPGSSFLSWGSPGLEVSHLILLLRANFSPGRTVGRLPAKSGQEKCVTELCNPTRWLPRARKNCVQGKKEQEFQTADVENLGWAALNWEEWTFHFVNPFLLKIILIAFEKYPWGLFSPVL